jgi:SAM-dependent methyltransferase
MSPKQRQEMIYEIIRVLRPNAEFLISVSNRFFPLGGSPHWMPPFWSFLPKSVGLKFAKYVVNSQDYNIYKHYLFSISPWKLRDLLYGQFDSVKYIILELGKQFGLDVWPEWFNSIYPLIYRLTSRPSLRAVFESTFGYVAYRAQSPRLVSNQ